MTLLQVTFSINFLPKVFWTEKTNCLDKHSTKFRKKGKYEKEFVIIKSKSPLQNTFLKNRGKN